MLKKSLVFVISATILTACSSGYNASSGINNRQYQPYKVSDADVMKWIEEGNKAEQCLFPRQWKNNSLSGLSNEEKALHQKYVHQIPLMNIIGSSNFQRVANDQNAQRHLEQQFLTFNHSKKTHFDKNWCNNLKSQYKQELAQIRENIKQQKAQLAAQEKARKEREAYLRTPEGQAELARQQQLAYQQQMLAQQRAYQEKMLEMQRRAALPDNSDPFAFGNSVNSAFQNVTNTIQRNTQLINDATRNARSSCQSIGQGWGTGAWQNVCY